MKQTILLGDRVYELERPRSWPSDFAPDAWNYSHSLALVCPKCLAQWAILAFEGDLEVHPQGAYCEGHGDGRLLLNYGPIDLPLLEAMPEELLKREFLLTIRQLEV